MALAFGLSLLRGETAPLPMDLVWSVLCGVVGGVGITALYHGLAVGRMGVVAPVTGVLAALIPVVAGIVLEGVPSALTLVGIVLAIVAVVLVSRVSDASSGPSGLRFALVAGLGIGLFSVFVAQVSDGHAFGPLAVIRLVEAVLIGVVVLVTGAVVAPGTPLRARDGRRRRPRHGRQRRSSSWPSRAGRWRWPPSCRRSTR